MYDTSVKRKWDTANVIDYARREGEEKGAAQKGRQLVKNLIQDTDFDDAKIASLAVVPLSFVEKVRADLAKEKK